MFFVVSRRAVRTAILSSVASAMFMPVIAAAETADADQDAQERRDIIVNGRVEAESGYKVSASRSASRTDTPLVDVPQAINIVSVKQIED